MKLSILDQAPVLAGGTPREALVHSLRLAQAGERLGYARFWMAEHHDLGGLACSAPEIMLGYIGANTSSIRLGAGAILLPYYRPYKVAETFNLLSTLFPGRIDLGIARSPGGSAEVSMALADRFLDNVWKLPEAFEELLRFLDGTHPADHPYSRIAAAPLPPVPPEPWVLGTSKKSARLAAEQGTAYAYGLFMNEENAKEAVETYFESFQPRRTLKKPYLILAVSALCADTAERALELSLSSFATGWQASRGTPIEGGIPAPEEARRFLEGLGEDEIRSRMMARSAIGTPAEVRRRLERWRDEYQADELMLLSYAHDFADRLGSYERIAREMGLTPRTLS
ncbi:LLM class flavin-dependent oxidoreductase [Cohnella xylanilytica]|uniref:LLM class flavin-dependent oxidoreductase n=1 Tax=Cohnella xylanilytica TaxID=557555 RepID=A0A841TZA7_9BACL|nr:LLM class flavin-dependent oxidoreductase [Cohnella xylanilytica]MBB6692889.1 LLM class flavin-dependent oxidoreductase [Cohnella xylanilytica]